MNSDRDKIITPPGWDAELAGKDNVVVPFVQGDLGDKAPLPQLGAPLAPLADEARSPKRSRSTLTKAEQSQKAKKTRAAREEQRRQHAQNSAHIQAAIKPGPVLPTEFDTDRDVMFAFANYSVVQQRFCSVITHNNQRIRFRCKTSIDFCSHELNATHPVGGRWRVTKQIGHNCANPENQAHKRQLYAPNFFYIQHLSHLFNDDSIPSSAHVAEKMKEIEGREVQRFPAFRIYMNCLSDRYGTEESSFSMLESNFELLRNTDPDTYAVREVDAQNRFCGAFMAVGASRRAIGTLRPLTMIDVFEMHQKHDQYLFFASNAAANSQIVHMACAVVPMESTGAAAAAAAAAGAAGSPTSNPFVWFMRMLLTVFPKMNQPKEHLLASGSGQVFIVSDDRVMAAAKEVFPNSVCRRSLLHLAQAHRKFLKNTDLTKGEVNRAIRVFQNMASTHQPEKFSQHEQELDKMNAGIRKQILESFPYQEWSASHMPPGFRTWEQHSTLWTEEPPNLPFVPKQISLPVLAIFRLYFKAANSAYAAIHDEVKQFEQRSPTIVCKTMLEKIPQVLEHGELESLAIERKTDRTGHVRHPQSGNYFFVDLEKQTCSCGRWQGLGMPCTHAIKMARHLEVDDSLLFHPCFRQTALEETAVAAGAPIVWKHTIAHDNTLPPRGKSKRRGHQNDVVLGDEPIPIPNPGKRHKPKHADPKGPAVELPPHYPE